MKFFSQNRWMRWIEITGYALVFLPFLTDFLESGKWPQSPRQLLTEVTLGLLVLLYVRVIARSRRRLIRMEEDRENLTALLLHDMKTPLTVVMASLSYLNEHPDDPERHKWIKVALRSCREDEELMTQLVEADRLGGNRFPMEKTSVNVPELLRSCSEEISATAFMKNVAFTASHAPEVETVLADEGLLRRVLMNLMRNALKFTKPGGTLDVRAETQRGWLVVKMQDTGVGISPEHMDRLFTRYSRIRTRTEDGEAREGWGLGLYFCKLAVEAHGGRIDVHSRPGHGTLVRFEIPLNDGSVKRFEESGLLDGVEEVNS